MSAGKDIEQYFSDLASSVYVGTRTAILEKEQCQAIVDVFRECRSLRAALREAIEWNWITDTEEIPDEIADQINDALKSEKLYKDGES